MATKDCDLPKGKTKAFDNSFSNHGDQYSNLNLNKPHQCADNNYGHSTINSSHNERKGYDCKPFKAKGIEKDLSKAERNIGLQHKNDKNQLTLVSSNFGLKNAKESEKSWKKDESLNKTSSSTLSLHIAAYENSIEAANANDIELPAKEKGKIKKIVHALTGNDSLSMNQFEIPRQQTDEKSEPEIMQYQASQKLLNPNQTGSSSLSSDNQNTVAKSTSNESTSFIDCITRACLGRTAQIGDVYDARSEQLLTGINIFNTTKLPVERVNITSTERFTSEFITSSKLSDKYTALNLHGEVAVSLMAGLIKGSGSLEYVNVNANSKESVQCSFIQKIRTIDEKININDEKLKALIAPNIGELCGTHVVVGISWGANAAITMIYENCNNEAKKKIEGQLQLAFSKLKLLSVEGSGNGTYDERENEFVNGINFKVFADVHPTGFEAPSNVTEAMAYIQNLVKKFADENVQGKQMELYLLPLQIVQQIFGLQGICDHVLVNLEMDCIKRLEQLFDMVDESSASLQSLEKFVENEKNIAKEDKNAIRGFANNFEAETSEMRQKLGNMLQKVRSSNAEAYEIEILRSEFMKSEVTSSQKVNAFVDSYKHLKEKLDFIKNCQQNGIVTVTETSHLANIKRENRDTNIFMLFQSFNNDRLLPQWTENINFFYTLQKQPGTKLLVVVDADILPNIAKNESLPDGIRVAQYFNGKYISGDCLELQKKMDSQCLAACEIIHPCRKVGIKAVQINFPCPKSLGYGKCSKINREWVCANCRQEIVYNFDGKFYCDCGCNIVEEFLFKCSDPMHGNDYCKFEKETLDQLVEDIKPLPEVNILVIGETGVGKSTWINALANYISYDTIDDVLKNDVINLIPTQFELTETRDGQKLQKSIKVGASSNEDFTEGQSTTQSCRPYVFRHNNCIYRIIDTPGIHDSRGIEQDKKNMENIMKFISLYKEIHGICILMKPNEAVLTPSFEWCFKQLLLNFHRSAIENIVFCFTQTSGYNFEVAQTLTPLNVLLNEIKEKRQITIPTSVERMYACDNMAYRYFCAVKHYNIEYPPDQQELYKRSYNISRDVTQKMLDYLLNRKPHSVEDSISIYRARDIIQRLTHPLALISSAVHETLEKVAYKQQLIYSHKNDENELRKILIKRIPFKRWIMKFYEQHFCNRCATLEYYRGNDRSQFLEADPSAMENDPFVLNVVKNNLKGMDDKCPDCGPNTIAILGSKWLCSEIGTREEEDTTIAAEMKEKLKTREGIQEEIKKVQKLKEELIAENDVIVKASARFAHFLGEYSITTYNDATEKYLKLLIQREEKTGNESKKMLYENLLSQYDAEKIVIERQLKNASKFVNKTIAASDIMTIVDDLKKLKHYGQDIADSLGECSKAILYEASAEETEVRLPNQKRTKWEGFLTWFWQPYKEN